MAYVSKDSNGNITGVYRCPQPDAIDGEGNVTPGVSTVEIADNDLALVAFLSPQSPAPQPTISDIIAVLSPDQQAALTAKVSAGMAAVKATS